VGDLDDDGDLEIVLVTWLAQLIILDHTGVPIISAIDLPTFAAATRRSAIWTAMAIWRLSRNSGMQAVRLPS